MNPLNPVILCVDDEEANLKLLEKLLVPRGYVVVSAANGKDALLKIKSQAIDLVLLDIIMPGMNGFEVCRQIKEDQNLRNIPVIMITASIVKKDRILGIEAGAEEFLSKPFDLAEVLARIKMLLKMKRLDDERKLAESQREVAIEELKKSNDLLERRVRERTAELAQANEMLQADISERKQTETTLRTSEERFSKVFQASPAPTYISTISEGRYIDVNNSGMQLLGYTRKEMIGHTVRELGIWHTSSERKLIVKKLIAKGSVRNEPVLLRTKNGEIKETLLSCEIIRLNDEEVMLSLVYDITERKRAEESLRQSEEKYRTILENIQEGYFEVDLSGNFTFFNDSLCRIIGYSKEDLLGMNNRQYTDKETAEKIFQTFNKIYNTGEPTEGFDWQFVRKDGTKRYIDESISLQKDSSGKPIGFRGIVRDVTERKQAEEALKNSELKYRNIFENAVEGIYQSTIEGRFITANAACSQMSGYDSPEELMESIKDIGTQLYVHPEDRNRLMEIREAKGFVEDFEVEFYKKDGSKFWVVVNARTVKDEQGKILYIEGLIEDITIRKHAEEQLQRTLESLRKSFGATIQVMVSAIEMRDPYTAGHQLRVANIACAIATEMGLPQDKIEGIRMVVLSMTSENYPYPRRYWSNLPS